MVHEAAAFCQRAATASRRPGSPSGTSSSPTASIPYKNLSGYRGKHMLALNAEQEVADGIGVFARLSWNDGRMQNWMFTEMDRAVSAAFPPRGLRRARPGDTAGPAAHLSWISARRRPHLEAGGMCVIPGAARPYPAPERVSVLYLDPR